MNLETSVTRSDAYDQRKGIHYRMHAENVDCLTAARVEVCVLANNHVLDYGSTGLIDYRRCLGTALAFLVRAQRTTDCTVRERGGFGAHSAIASSGST